MLQELAIVNALFKLVLGGKVVVCALLCRQVGNSQYHSQLCERAASHKNAAPRRAHFLSFPRLTSCMTAGEAEFVGSGHQLLDQGAFAYAGRATNDHGAGKGLACVYNSWSGCRLCRRGCLCAFCSSHGRGFKTSTHQEHVRCDSEQADFALESKHCGSMIICNHASARQAGRREKDNAPLPNAKGIMSKGQKRC